MKQLNIMDKTTITEWGQNEDVFHWEQDEDLGFSTIFSFDELIQYAGDESFLKEKQDILLSAACVIVYDEIQNKRSDQKEINRMVQELKIRSDRLVSISEDVLNDYIREVVFPAMGL